MTADAAVTLDRLIHDWSTGSDPRDIHIYLGVNRATFEAWERDEITAEALLAARQVTT